MKNRSGSEEILRCSFCHKSQDAVAKLISSPSDYPRAYICDECVAVAVRIMQETPPPGSATYPMPERLKVRWRVLLKKILLREVQFAPTP